MADNSLVNLESVQSEIELTRMELESELFDLYEKQRILEEKIASLGELERSVASKISQFASIDAAGSATQAVQTYSSPSVRQIEIRPVAKALQDLENKQIQNWTIRDMVVGLLRHNPSGLPATEIASIIDQQFGNGMTRANLSPHLSRFKQEGLLRLNGDYWQLAFNLPG